MPLHTQSGVPLTKTPTTPSRSEKLKPSCAAASVKSRTVSRCLKSAAAALSIAVVWLTDPFSVIALSSRAFALFYASQAVLALWVSIRTGAGGWAHRAGFAAVGLICIVAALAGAPAEG